MELTTTWPPPAIPAAPANGSFCGWLKSLYLSTRPHIRSACEGTGLLSAAPPPAINWHNLAAVSEAAYIVKEMVICYPLMVRCSNTTFRGSVAPACRPCSNQYPVTSPPPPAHLPAIARRTHLD